MVDDPLPGDTEQEMRKKWDHVRGAHFDVPARKELSADMVAAGARLVIWTGVGSIALLQRRLGITFGLAGQVMDELVRYEVVGPKDEGSRSFPVRHSRDQAHEVFKWLTGLWKPASQ